MEDEIHANKLEKTVIEKAKLKDIKQIFYNSDKRIFTDENSEEVNGQYLGISNLILIYKTRKVKNTGRGILIHGEHTFEKFLEKYQKKRVIFI